MTRDTRERPPAAGYRGSLPPRNDHLATPWVVAVVAVFVLVLVLSFAGLPSKLFPAASPNPEGSAIPSGSAISGASGLPSASP